MLVNGNAKTMADLERLRSALGGEPSLVLFTESAAMGCDALELVFVDRRGLQRLKLKEIKKVTHVSGDLVVTGDAVTIRGAFPVESDTLKAFFADVQTLRKRREKGLEATIHSVFSPPGTTKPQLEPPSESREPVAASKPQEIPGFSLGLSPALEAALPAPVKPAAPLQVTPPVAAVSAPTPAPEPSVPPTPRAAELDDWSLPRTPKPNPRAGLAPQRETLPPPKPNPRVVPVQPVSPVEAPPIEAKAAEPMPEPFKDVPFSTGMNSSQTVASTLEPAIPAPLLESPLASIPQLEPSRPARATPSSSEIAEPTMPKPQAVARGTEVQKESRPIPKSKASTSRPNATSTRPATPKFTAPKLVAPKIDLPKLDTARFTEHLKARTLEGLKNAQTKGALLWRRIGAGAIDAALTAALMWLVTRFIGGRELETLLQLSNSARADIGLLNTLKDLLPLIIAGALSAVLAATAVGLLYNAGAELSPLRASVGKRALGLQLRSVQGGAPTLMATSARFLMKAMLVLVPAVLGLLPTLLAMNGPATALRSTLQFFSLSVWVSWAALLIGHLPIYGGRGQTLPDYLTDCIVKPAPIARTTQPDAVA
jgi:uncharacterized RDD family membrane protein YckC